MNDIEIKKHECPICKSMSTETKAVFDGKQYRLKTKCLNIYCLSNKLN